MRSNERTTKSCWSGCDGWIFVCCWRIVRHGISQFSWIVSFNRKHLKYLSTLIYEIYSFDPEQDRWVLIAPMRSKRLAVGVAVVNRLVRQICIVILIYNSHHLHISIFSFMLSAALMENTGSRRWNVIILKTTPGLICRQWKCHARALELRCSINTFTLSEALTARDSCRRSSALTRTDKHGKRLRQWRLQGAPCRWMW